MKHNFANFKRIRFMHVGWLLLFLLMAGVVKTAVAQTGPITFTGFTGAGFTPAPAAGQLDSDYWRVQGLSDGAGTFGGTFTTGDFARGSSNGGVVQGGVYAFNAGPPGNVALGIQPGGPDFTPGNFTLRITNDTGNTINNIYVAYDILVFNDRDRNNSFNFSYSTDDLTYTPIPALDYTSPTTRDPAPVAWVTVPRSTTITGLTLAPGAFFYLQWTGDDVSFVGQRDEFGLDNVDVRVNSPTAVTLTSFSFDQPAAQNTNIVLLAALLTAVVGSLFILRGRQGTRP